MTTCSKDFPTKPGQLSTWVELLRLRATRQPERPAFRFLPDAGAAVTLTYSELDRKAKAVAALLQSNGAAGERALLLYAPGPDYVAAFFGCLYAGAVAVPAYPPRNNRSLPRLQSIAADAGALVTLTTRAILSREEKSLAQVPGLKSLRWLATDNLPAELADEWREPAVSGETPRVPAIHLRLDRRAQGRDGRATATCCTTRRCSRGRSSTPTRPSA